MATNFEVLGSIGPLGGGFQFKFNRSNFLLFGNPTTMGFVGLAVTPTKLILNFDKIPQLSGTALVPANWTISGGTVITTTAVAVVGNTVELDISGIFDSNDYSLAVPVAGLTSDSGVPADPYTYSGPPTIVFAVGTFTPTPTPPTISNVVPAPGTGIYVNTPLQFDVVDADSFAALLLYVSFADGTKEVAYDGSSFSTTYRMSITSPISNGLRFVVNRMGGWPSAPSLSVVAVDGLGASV